MNGLQSLSNDLAAAVDRGGRSVFGVNGRARLGSTGVLWRQGLVVTADHTVHVDEEVTITRPDGRALTAITRGDIPGISCVVIDGQVRVGRSRNTPMAKRMATFRGVSVAGAGH